MEDKPRLTGHLAHETIFRVVTRERHGGPLGVPRHKLANILHQLLDRCGLILVDIALDLSSKKQRVVVGGEDRRECGVSTLLIPKRRCFSFIAFLVRHSLADCRVSRKCKMVLLHSTAVQWPSPLRRRQHVLGW